MESAEQLKTEGMAAFQQKSWQVAVQKFEQAEARFKADGDGVGQAEMLNNLGVLYKMQGAYEQSLQAFETAVSLFTSLNMTKEAGQAHGNMGDLFVAQKQHKKAASAYLQSAHLLAEAKAALEQSQLLRTLSLFYLRRGQWLESIRRMEQSLTVKPRIGLDERLFRTLLRFAMNLLGLSRA